MHSVFLSYSRQDTAVVERVAEKIEQAGYPIWIDRSGIHGGEQWRNAIVDAIEAANVFIIFLSPNSVKSTNVRKELDLADTSKISIIPITIASITIPQQMKYQLAGVQIIDGWRLADGGFSQICRALKELQVHCNRHSQQPSDVSQRQSGEPGNIDLSGLGSLGFLSRLMFFHRKH
ncbi:MAG: toll/interleukin-1 receptor domain-containing protein [Methylococcales bacterium]|nr:toll/interleukin-1 receptor domain-containing protein [Methylococcales bacterium]